MQLEKDLKLEKKKQLNQIKEVWKYEKDKLDILVKDDDFLEKEIKSLYNKS